MHENDRERNETFRPDVDSPHNDKETPEIGTRSLQGWKWLLAVFAILSSVFLFSMDTTVVADIQPQIIQAVGEFEKYPWLGSAFVLPGATLQLPWSKAYSLLNLKWLFFANVTLFEIGSAISGAAPTMNALIVGRAIAGVGGCGMYIGCLTFLSVATTPKERPFYVSLVTPVWGLGTVLGPLIGGAFAESAVGWRWGFFVNLFIYAALAPIMLLIIPSMDFEPTLSYEQKFARFDWLGLVIFVGWGISFVMAIQFGGTVYAWNSHSEIILWVFTGALFIAMVLGHIYHPFVAAQDRLYPAHMLKNLRLGVLQFATFAGAGAVYVPIYYLPLYFQFARGESAIQAAIRLLPFVVTVVVFSIVNGVLATRIRYILPWYLVGGLLATTGGALFYTVRSETSNAAIYGYSIIIGSGGGLMLMSAFGSVNAVVGENDVFNAIGVLGVAQGMGIVFFISCAGIVYQNLGLLYVQPLIPVGFTGRLGNILAGSHSAEYQSFPEDVRNRIMESIILAMSNVYTLPIAAGGLTVVFSLFLGKSKLKH